MTINTNNYEFHDLSFIDTLHPQAKTEWKSTSNWTKWGSRDTWRMETNPDGLTKLYHITQSPLERLGATINEWLHVKFFPEIEVRTDVLKDISDNELKDLTEIIENCQTSNKINEELRKKLTEINLRVSHSAAFVLNVESNSVEEQNSSVEEDTTNSHNQEEFHRDESDEKPLPSNDSREQKTVIDSLPINLSIQNENENEKKDLSKEEENNNNERNASQQSELTEESLPNNQDITTKSSSSLLSVYQEESLQETQELPEKDLIHTEDSEKESSFETSATTHGSLTEPEEINEEGSDLQEEAIPQDLMEEKPIQERRPLTFAQSSVSPPYIEHISQPVIKGYSREKFALLITMLNLDQNEAALFHSGLVNTSKKKPEEFSFNFLNFHEQIESQQNSLDLPTTAGPQTTAVLEKLKVVTEQFEDLIIGSARLINSNEAKEIESLIQTLNQLKEENAALIKGEKEFNPEVYKILKKLSHSLNAALENYGQIVEAQDQAQKIQQATHEVMLSLNDQREALEEGDLEFSLQHDRPALKASLNILHVYKTFGNKNQIHFYYPEFLAALTRDMTSLRWSREDFYEQYQEAIKAEVFNFLKTSNEEDDHHLLTTLNQEKEQLLELKEAFDQEMLDLSNDPLDKASKKLLSEFKTIHKELTVNLKFFEEQIKLLTAKQPVGLKGNWTIHFRGQEVKRNVRLANELKEEKVAGWGKKLINFCLWSLYITPQVHSLASFGNQTYQAYQTGESPLKESAEAMSIAVFAQHAKELPPEKQQKNDQETSFLKGIFSGFIPLTESLEERFPNVANYLKPF